jgi:hypothetical protein
MLGYGRAYYNGGNYLVRGTSVSAPMFASVIALLNDERISAGKQPLPGWINPTLYSVPSAFNDVTLGGQTLLSPCRAEALITKTGSNTGSFTPGINCTEAYTASSE